MERCRDVKCEYQCLVDAADQNQRNRASGRVAAVIYGISECGRANQCWAAAAPIVAEAAINVMDISVGRTVKDMSVGRTVLTCLKQKCNKLLLPCKRPDVSCGDQCMEKCKDQQCEMQCLGDAAENAKWESLKVLYEINLCGDPGGCFPFDISSTADQPLII